MLGGAAFCSPEYAELQDETESRCCNFKTKREKMVERSMGRHLVPHYNSIRAPKKVQFIAAICLLVYGFALTFAPEYMAFNLFLGEEYMRDEGFDMTADQAQQELNAQILLEQTQLQKELLAVGAEKDSNPMLMNILQTIMAPEAKILESLISSDDDDDKKKSPAETQQQQLILAAKAAKEAEVELRRLELEHEKERREARARGTASMPFQQFSRLYGSVVMAIAIHGLSTVTTDYTTNCSVSQFYIIFYGSQAVAMLMAVMPIVKVDGAITTVISSSWLLKCLMCLMAFSCAFWVWIYQRLRVAGSHIDEIKDSQLDESDDFN